MVAVKGAEADRVVARPPESAGFFLLYGPDSGAVAERATRIATALADPSDPFSLLKYDAGEITSDPNRLPDEAYAVSMFGGRRSILIRDGGSRPTLVGILANLMKQPPPETTIVVQAGDLRKSHALIPLFDRSRTAISIACYVDNEAAISRVIDEEIHEAKLSIDQEARSILIGHLGGDRMLTRSEVRKLCLYCHGEGRIQRHHVEELIGDTSAVSVDEIVDAAATGNIGETNDRLIRAAADGITPDRIANAALRHFVQLDAWRGEVDSGRRPADVIANARPPVHFSRRDKTALALGIWGSARIEKAVALLSDVARDQRLNAGMSADLVSDALLTIARSAAQTARNRR